MLGKYCETAYFDGIHELYRSRNNKAKFLFWISVMTLTLTAAIWFTYETCIGYMTSPIVSSVTTIRSPTMDLPEVLICYNGGLNVTAMKEENLSENLIHSLHLNLYGGRPDLESNDRRIAANLELGAYMSLMNFGIKEIVERFSYKRQDVVTVFKYGGNKTGACNVTETVLTPNGNCFSFVHNGQQNYPSLSGGLMFKLKLPGNSYAEVFLDETSELDLSKDFSFTLEKTLGGQQSFRWIVIAPYTRTEVVLWTKLYKRSLKGCENDPLFYTSNTCFERCYIAIAIEVCNCVPNHDWINIPGKNAVACNPLNFTCEMDPDKYKEIRKCQKACKPMCSEWIFETSLSSSSPSYDNTHPAYVKIAYNTMQYTQVSTQGLGYVPKFGQNFYYSSPDNQLTKPANKNFQ